MVNYCKKWEKFNKFFIWIFNFSQIFERSQRNWTKNSDGMCWSLLKINFYSHSKGKPSTLSKHFPYSPNPVSTPVLCNVASFQHLEPQHNEPPKSKYIRSTASLRHYCASRKLVAFSHVQNLSEVIRSPTKSRSINRQKHEWLKTGCGIFFIS